MLPNYELFSNKRRILYVMNKGNNSKIKYCLEQYMSCLLQQSKQIWTR